MASSSTIPTDKLKDKGKSILEGPEKPQPSSTLEILHRSTKFKKVLDNLSLEVDAKEAMAQPPPKNQNVYETIAQTQLQEEIPQPPPQAIQRVE